MAKAARSSSRKGVLGVCKLTKQSGKFVKAHLIPKALTRPAAAGAPFVDLSFPDRRPRRAWSSWYDNRLVTAEGEAILAEFDNWAIPELRRQKLVWSGWGPFSVLPTDVDHSVNGDTGWGLRRLKDIDFKKLRLFFLSLLWRAAASTHFVEISLSEKELDELGSKLIERDPGPPNYFSIHLNQLSTIGEAHNLTPIAQTKRIPAIEDVEEHFVPFFRIYFDGLIAHIHPNNEPSYEGSKLGPLVLGQEEFMTVATVKYENSFQRENLQILQSEAWRNWPELMLKL